MTNDYSCAMWPAADIPCRDCHDSSNCTFYVAPCKAPKTVDVELNTCDHIMSRDLHAESHIIAWAAICSLAIVGVVVVATHVALSHHSFLQTMWIDAYRTAEFETFQRKIKIRANDLASELVNEYLIEERGKGKSIKTG